MNSMGGSINTFNSDRPLFLREILNQTYVPGAYFMGRSIAVFPIELTIPIIAIGIPYYVIGLNPIWYVYLTAIFIGIITFWYGAAIGLIISILVPNIQMAAALFPFVCLALRLK